MKGIDFYNKVAPGVVASLVDHEKNVAYTLKNLATYCGVPYSEDELKRRIEEAKSDFDSLSDYHKPFKSRHGSLNLFRNTLGWL